MLYPKSTIAAILTYYAVIFTGRELMRTRSAFKLNTLFLIHNLYLTATSGALLALFLEEMNLMICSRGSYFAICSTEVWALRLETLYYVSLHHDFTQQPKLTDYR